MMFCTRLHVNMITYFVQLEKWKNSLVIAKLYMESKALVLYFITVYYYNVLS